MRFLLAPAAVLAAALSAVPASAQVPADAPTLTVVETAVARAEPDSATVVVSFSRRATSASAARRAVDVPVRALLGRLGALGVPTADVRTDEVALRRVTLRRPQRVRWVASTRLVIRVAPIARLPRVLELAGASGAASVDGPMFAVEDPARARADAALLAITRARRRADAAAAALGLRVIALRSVVLDPLPDNIVPSGAEAGPVPRPAPPPVEPGRQEISATVRVVFALGA